MSAFAQIGVIVRAADLKPKQHFLTNKIPEFSDSDNRNASGALIMKFLLLHRLT